MKKSILTLGTIIAFVAGTVFLTSCGSGTSEQESTENQDAEEHDHNEMASANYFCPMHPEVTGKEGDKCSKCKMNLTKTSDSDEMGDHKHDMDTIAYSCPMHPNEKGIKGDTCSKCKMDLTASSDKMSMKSCNHKDGKSCDMCAGKEGMKCDHKKGKTCPNCKKA